MVVKLSIEDVLKQLGLTKEDYDKWTERSTESEPQTKAERTKLHRMARVRQKTRKYFA